jgi:hypothetical protein
MDSWNNIFFDNDAQAHESSDSSDSDFDPFSINPSLSEGEENDVGPAIEVINTQNLRVRMEGRMVDKVREVLHVMARLGINLTIFLDAVSWGDPECTADAKVRSARTGLMKSQELPSILQRWWKPPRTPGSSNARTAGATHVMTSFACQCYLTAVDMELEQMGSLFKSPVGDDVAEDHLTAVRFADLIKEVKERGPLLWSILYKLAYREDQLARNTHKNADKVHNIDLDC